MVNIASQGWKGLSAEILNPNIITTTVATGSGRAKVYGYMDEDSTIYWTDGSQSNKDITVDDDTAKHVKTVNYHWNEIAWLYSFMPKADAVQDEKWDFDDKYLAHESSLSDILTKEEELTSSCCTRRY